MKLTSIKRGDIVRVDDGLMPWYGMAEGGPERQRVPVRALHGAKGLHRVKARDVTGVWHQSKATEPFLAFKE